MDKDLISFCVLLSVIIVFAIVVKKALNKNYVSDSTVENHEPNSLDSINGKVDNYSNTGNKIVASKKTSVFLIILFIILVGVSLLVLPTYIGFLGYIICPIILIYMIKYGKIPFI